MKSHTRLSMLTHSQKLHHIDFNNIYFQQSGATIHTMHTAGEEEHFHPTKERTIIAQDHTRSSLFQAWDELIPLMLFQSHITICNNYYCHIHNYNMYLLYTCFLVSV